MTCVFFKYIYVNIMAIIVINILHAFMNWWTIWRRYNIFWSLRSLYPQYCFMNNNQTSLSIISTLNLYNKIASILTRIFLYKINTPLFTSNDCFKSMCKYPVYQQSRCLFSYLIRQYLLYDKIVISVWWNIKNEYAHIL